MHDCCLNAAEILVDLTEEFSDFVAHSYCKVNAIPLALKGSSESQAVWSVYGMHMTENFKNLEAVKLEYDQLPDNTSWTVK